MVQIKKKIHFADNGIMIQDLRSGFCDVTEYHHRIDGSKDVTPAKAAIGDDIYELAMECLGEDLPDGEILVGFTMDVVLKPVTEKKKGV